MWFPETEPKQRVKKMHRSLIQFINWDLGLTTVQKRSKSIVEAPDRVPKRINGCYYIVVHPRFKVKWGSSKIPQPITSCMYIYDIKDLLNIPTLPVCAVSLQLLCNLPVSLASFKVLTDIDLPSPDFFLPLHLSNSGPIHSLHRAHHSRNVGQGLRIPQVHLGPLAVERVHFLCPLHELLHPELQKETHPGGSRKNHRSRSSDSCRRSQESQLRSSRCREMGG